MIRKQDASGLNFIRILLHINFTGYEKNINFIFIMGEIRDNYIDTFFRCATDKEQICEKMVTDHMLAYVVSGEMLVYNRNKQVIIRKGEVVVMRRNHLANKIKHPTKKGEPFLGLFLHLNAPMLKKISSQITIPDVMPGTI